MGKDTGDGSGGGTAGRKASRKRGGKETKVDNAGKSILGDLRRKKDSPATTAPDQ